jgi:hypothetical protein
VSTVKSPNVTDTYLVPAWRGGGEERKWRGNRKLSYNHIHFIPVNTTLFAAGRVSSDLHNEMQQNMKIFSRFEGFQAVSARPSGKGRLERR